MPRLLCLMLFGAEVMVDGFFDNDSDNFVSVVCQASLFPAAVLRGGCWVLFSTESLILAQDERWRRA